MAQNNQLTCEFHTFYSPISNQMYFKLTHSARSLIIKMIRAQMEWIFIFGMNENRNPNVFFSVTLNWNSSNNYYYGDEIDSVTEKIW